MAMKEIDNARATELNPSQKEIVEQGLLTSGFNCILQMPTGSGKTWLAEHAILATLLRGQRAIYVTPLRALANELLARWQRQFHGFEVGVFTGEYGHRKDYPVPFERAKLLVMTPERLDACTRHWHSHWSWLPEVNLLVVDELHLLGENGRGPRLEGAILRVRRLNPFLQLLGLSATLGNRAELADWLAGVHFGSDWRPIPISWRSVRYQRATDKPRILREQIESCIAAAGQSLVFVQSRRRAEMLARELRNSGVLAEHHHAGLDSEDRQRTESEYRAGRLRVLVSTGTLEMGLNLPARQVILYDLQHFNGIDFVALSTNTVWQRAGRAGRRGLDAQGEVVLFAPSWDRTPDRYALGKFERILSGLSDKHALGEQVLAEVSSGLARTRSQLDRALQQSLAAHQNRLPQLDQTVNEMIEAGMIVEVSEEGRTGSVLKAARLGRIAVRQMLAPATIVSLARSLRSTAQEAEPSLTFLDILLRCVDTDDCEPLIPADFEELEALGSSFSAESSLLLTGPHASVTDRFRSRGRRLLAVIKTALVAREWTRVGEPNVVATKFCCYPFEVRRLSESLERLLTAAVAVLEPSKGQENSLDNDRIGTLTGEALPLRERIRALVAMVSSGLDEQTVTLTFIRGIGATIARRLRDAGIADIEVLGSAEPEELSGLRGVSHERATRWVNEAAELVKRKSALALREFGAKVNTSASNWPRDIDQYRLRRALDLNVRRQNGSFVVSGGLEPHRVRIDSDWLQCDCADATSGQNCKHLLAVRLSRREPLIISLIAKLNSTGASSELDLFKLWLEGGTIGNHIQRFYVAWN